MEFVHKLSIPKKLPTEVGLPSDCSSSLQSSLNPTYYSQTGEDKFLNDNFFKN